MLVLTRKTNEVILIDDDVEITILGVDSGQVKLGINAPKSVKVYRKEVYDRIKEENQAAADASSKSEIKDLVKKLKDFAK